MASFRIKGGNPLRGEVNSVPNKNSILALIPACILTEEPIVLHNVPKSSSVRVMLRIFRNLGGKVAYLKKNVIRLDSSNVNKYVIDKELAKKEKAIVMFLGPLLSRFGKAVLGSAGGCKLGNRPLDTLFQGLKLLNTKVDNKNNYKLSTKGLKGNEDIWLIEASVTGTENIILAAVKAKGRTIIYNAACEPHTQDLCNFLISIGAKIQGVGTNKLIIEGVDDLKGGEWKVIPDHIDIGGLIVASAVTKGEILIKNAIPQHMTQILNYFSKINLEVEIRGSDIFVPGNQKLICKRNIKGDIDKIPDQPWPGFPVDLIPQAIVLASKAEGSIKIYSVMYETQLMFVHELLKLKANLIFPNPQQVVTSGPSRFKGSNIEAPSILQCIHALVIAGLSAEGTTIIKNTNIISRRYPNLIKRIKNLGGRIEKIR